MKPEYIQCSVFFLQLKKFHADSKKLPHACVHSKETNRSLSKQIADINAN